MKVERLLEEVISFDDATLFAEWWEAFDSLYVKLSTSTIRDVNFKNKIREFRDLMRDKHQQSVSVIGKLKDD
jgi:hypothetical protein